MKKLYPLLSVLFLIYWGCEEQDTTGILTPPTEVTLWGVVYSIENTTNLGLSYSQLTGIIPDEICNQGDSSPSLSNNKLCPPYPSCIEDYVGEQDLCSCGFDDDDMVYLWGNCYLIENTTVLNLSNSGLTGSIPPEIGNLTNLTELVLSDNQLSGIIPEEICNQGDSSPSLSNNQLCPPYPSCIENYVGEQDTSGCD